MFTLKYLKLSTLSNVKLSTCRLGWSSLLLESTINFVFSLLIQSPILLLAVTRLDIVWMISYLVFPKMAILSAYVNIISLFTTSTWWLWFISRINFSRPKLNRVGDKASPYRRPDFTSKANDSSPRNFTLHSVLLLHNFTILTYFFGIPKKINVFHNSSLFILSYACL